MPAPAGETATRSAMDARLFYQLLIGELQLRQGDAGTAYQVLLDAAKRTRDPQLFRRAMDIALQARAGNEALSAVRAWREAVPGSADPVRLELQILAALNRPADAAAPIRSLIELTPAADRVALFGALPLMLERATDKRQTAEVLQTALEPYTAASETPRGRSAAWVAQGRAWLQADDPSRALELARRAATADPDGTAPPALALLLMAREPQAEDLVRAYLARPKPEPGLRLAYVRTLTGAQRYVDALAQLEQATRERPEVAGPYLTLGALHLELKHLDDAEAALKRYAELVTRPSSPDTPASGSADAQTAHETGLDAADEPRDQGLIQAWLMLAQVAEQRRDFAAAERWLARIDDPKRALEVQSRRALLMARQGQVDAAVAALRSLPEREAGDARAKLLAEAQLLRDVQRWQPAYDAFERAAQRFPDDIDLLYEQSMVAEKLGRLDAMERLLRRVIELQPDHAHAHNALGYALADRRLRLPEARALIVRALELRPGDPFITDSLGWVEYRMGNLDEAERQLRKAWSARPDTEIGAHLGEVLWAMGRRDDALAIWRQAQSRDSANEVLRETLARLQVKL